LDVVGRGKSRRLMLSQVGQRIVDSGVAPVERSDLIQKAALRPKIHRELWDRWRTSLPVGEVRAYLIRHREFQERGAEAVIAEYQKTLSFLDAVPSDHTPEGPRHVQLKESGHAAPNQGPRSLSLPQMLPGAENFVDLRFEGERLILSARVDRKGITDLIGILRANQVLVGRKQQMPRVADSPGKSRKRGE
jgi:hypothetical protein